MQEHHLNVTRTARYYTMGRKTTDTRRLWIVCHGYAQLASEFIMEFKAVDNGENLIVAPEGLSRFYSRGFSGRVGASWMTSEDRQYEIDDYVNYLEHCMDSVFDKTFDAQVKINALGFSQGVATICRWFVNTKYQIDNLFLWGATMPPELPSETSLARFKKTRVLFIHGNNDPFYEGRELEYELDRLAESGLITEVLRFNGEHCIDAGMLRKLAAY